MSLVLVKEKDPRLYAAVRRRAREVSAASSQRPWVLRLELLAAEEALKELGRQGVGRIAVAGYRPLYDILAASRLLDAFEVAALIHSDRSLRPLGPYGGVLPVLSVSEAEKLDVAGILVLDPNMVPAARNGMVRACVPVVDEGSLPFELPEGLRSHYESLAESFKLDVERRIGKLGPSEQVILFAGIYTFFNFNRLSIALRKRGVKTVFLSLNQANQAYKGSHFDLTLHAQGDLELFYWIISRFSFRVVHFQGWLNLHAFAAAAAACSRSPFVLEFNDVSSILFEPEEHDRLFGRGLAEEERVCVRQLVDTSDAVVSKYSSDGIDLIIERGGNLPPLRCFPSWPLEEFFAESEARDEEPIRLVFCGTVNPSYFPDPPFGDVKLLALMKILTEQGLEFHLFSNPYQGREERGVLWDYHYAAAREPRFFMHPACGPAELPQAICGMDYGLMLYLFSEEMTVKPEHLACTMPTKFFSYLEAGLPVLISEQFEALAALVREYRIGLVLGRNDLGGLRELLRSVDREELRRNVSEYRRRFSLEQRLFELEGLYEEAAQHRAVHSRRK